MTKYRWKRNNSFVFLLQCVELISTQPQIVMILKFSIKKQFLDVILLLKHQKHMMLSKEKNVRLHKHGDV